MSALTVEEDDDSPAPFRVLCVEDDEYAREATRENLEARGIGAVDFAEDTATATHQISAVRYDAVLVDVVLDDNPVTPTATEQGDEWLLRSLPQTAGALRAVVTGRVARIREPQRLRDENIRLVEKGDQELVLFTELEVLARRKRERSNAFPTYHPQDPIQIGGAMLANETLALFYDWIDALPDAQVRDIWIGDRLVSPTELKAEVVGATAVGRRFGRLFIEHVRDLLGLADGTDE